MQLNADIMNLLNDDNNKNDKLTQYDVIIFDR